jgi:pimeloyl-ACP methyl ester carboxylesterase
VSARDPAPPQVLLPAQVPGEVRQRHLVVGDDPGHASEGGAGRRRGVELAVVEVGPATAPAVVVAHGVGSSARFVVAAFAGPVVAAGGRLVTYDLRGHGASSPVREVAGHALGEHVRDLAAVVASLAEPPAVLGGVSLGGHAAVRVAGHLASSGTGAGAGAAGAVLACLPAWTGRARPGRGPHAAVAAEVNRVGIATVIGRLRDDRALVGWLRDTLVTDYARHDPASLTAALCALDGGEAPTVDELGRLGALPLAVVGWPDDPGHPIEVARRWAGLAPHGELGVLAIGDLEPSLARLGEVAIATVHRVAPHALR